MTSSRLVATDLDGTLLSSQRALGSIDRASLEALGERGVIRVIATGRSLFSARKVIRPDWPVDYLVFSSGAGVMDWRAQKLLRAESIEPPRVVHAVTALAGLGMDFMVHAPTPDNHCFFEWRSNAVNADFDRRRELYSEHLLGSANELVGRREMSQLLAIEPPDRLGGIERVRDALEGLRVVRTTSPLDGQSMWIEVFPSTVSKAAGVEWVRSQVAPRAATLAVGNDYNDIDLLEWAECAYVVANAAPELRARHRVVASNDDGGFSEAVSSWIS